MRQNDSIAPNFFLGIMNLILSYNDLEQFAFGIIFAFMTI